jgi:hypothetical protein
MTVYFDERRMCAGLADLVFGRDNGSETYSMCERRESGRRDWLEGCPELRVERRSGDLILCNKGVPWRKLGDD